MISVYVPFEDLDCGPDVLRRWAEMAAEMRCRRAVALMASDPSPGRARNVEACREQRRILGQYLGSVRIAEHYQVQP